MTLAIHPIARIHTVIDATRAALANPEDTAQVFRIAEALSFRTPQRLVSRVRSDARGARLLARRDDLLAVLSDRDRLEAMPAGSLGRAYLDFLDREKISAAGLVAASESGAAGHFQSDDDVAYLRRRMRDSHDLWHTVTGYHGDLLGEASLLAFSFAQTGHPGVGFLAGLGLLLAREPAARRMIAEGYVRGRRAAWLVPVDWIALLELPLDEVRRQLGVEPVGEYQQVRELTRFPYDRATGMAEHEQT